MKVSEASRKSHNGINEMITIWTVICWWIISRTIITWATWVWVTTWEGQISMVIAVTIVWVWWLIWVERVSIRVDII